MKKKLFYVAILCLTLVETFNIMPACCAEKNEFPFISVESYSVTKDKIIPGSDFTLTLELLNNSDTSSAKNVVIGIVCPAGVSPKYGTPGQMYLKEIDKRAVVNVSFDFNSIEEIYSYYLDFEITIFCDDSNNSINLRVPVGTDSPFNVTNFFVDEEGIEGGAASASVAFKVIGIDFVKNAVLKARVDGIEVNSISIGALSPGIGKAQLISVPLDFYGEHVISLALAYEDNTGKTGTMEIGSKTIYVNRKVAEPTPTPEIKQTGVLEQLKGNIKMFAGVVGSVVILGISLIFMIVNKKRKG